MSLVLQAKPQSLFLRAEFAADLMRPNPVSIRAGATVSEATAVLTDKGISAAPVIDEAGQPIGVLSRADVLAHERERAQTAVAVPNSYAGTDLTPPPAPQGDTSLVRDLMTPVIFSVGPETPAQKVVAEMLALRVHQLFVVDPAGVLVGVIGALDVLQHLHPEENAERE